MQQRKTQTGFTIVELLIVVVVIAILAAITIVSYNGIRDRANSSALQSTLSQLYRKIEVSKSSSTNQIYPATFADAGITNPPDNTVYTVNANATGYCVASTLNGVSYYITQDSSRPISGTCASVDGLVGWWPFDGDANDKSGNGTVSTPVNVTAAAGQNGQANGSYQFNGTSSTIGCGSDTLLRPTAAVSVSAWIYLDAYSTGSGISGIVNNGNGGYWLTVVPTGVPNFYISTNNLPAPSGISLSQWYHLVGTYTTGQKNLYLNGVKVATDTTSGAINYGVSGDACQIGSVKSVVDRYFKGRIDDVRIYNKVLSTAEVAALYAAGAQ